MKKSRVDMALFIWEKAGFYRRKRAFLLYIATHTGYIYKYKKGGENMKMDKEKISLATAIISLAAAIINMVASLFKGD